MSQAYKPDFKIIQGGSDAPAKNPKNTPTGNIEETQQWAVNKLKEDLVELCRADENSVFKMYKDLRNTSDIAKRLLSDRPLMEGEQNALETLDGLMPMREVLKKFLELQIKEAEECLRHVNKK